jgi:hypothetical protein
MVTTGFSTGLRGRGKEIIICFGVLLCCYAVVCGVCSVCSVCCAWCVVCGVCAVLHTYTGATFLLPLLQLLLFLSSSSSGPPHRLTNIGLYILPLSFFICAPRGPRIPNVTLSDPFIELNHWYPGFLRFPIPCKWPYPICALDGASREACRRHVADGGGGRGFVDLSGFKWLGS